MVDSKISEDFKAIEEAIKKEGRREFSIVARGENDQVSKRQAKEERDRGRMTR